MAQPGYSDGSMLALYPPASLARKLAIPGDLAQNDLHLTVAYSGDAANTDRKQLRKAAKALAQRDPVSATISGTPGSPAARRTSSSPSSTRRRSSSYAPTPWPSSGR